MNWTELLAERIVPSLKINKPAVYDIYSVNLSSSRKNYCPDCDLFWDSSTYTLRSNPCPSCAKETFVKADCSSVLPEKWFYVQPDSKEFVCFSVEVSHMPLPVPEDDTTSFLWLKGDFSYRPKIEFLGTCEKKLSFSDGIRKGTNEWAKRCNAIKSANLVNGKEFDLNSIFEPSHKTKSVKKASANEVEALEFDEPVPDSNYFKARTSYHLSKEMIRVRDRIKYKVYCSSANKTAEIFSANSSIVCPFCKGDALFTHYSSHHSNKTCVLFSTTKNKTLVARQFNYFSELTEDGIKTTLNEEKRVFFFKNEMLYYEKRTDGFTKTGLGSFLTGWNSSFGQAIQSPEEIADIIRNSSMNQTGLLEAWGLVPGFDGIESCGNIGKVSYISVYHKRPVIEKLLKAGLIKLLQELICCGNDEYSSFVDTTATTLTGALGVTKPELKLLKQLNAGRLETIQIKNLYRLDNTLSYELYMRMKLGKPNVRFEFEDIREKFGYSYQMQLDYLDNVYNNQCIERYDAITIWRDYLDMANKLHYRLDNPNTRLPSSLKKEHDRVMFTYRAFKEKINREQFEIRAKENSKYEYSKGDYVVIVPKAPEEVVREGTTLKHCVASYVNRIADGDTCIVFIRRKDAPDISLYTAEVKGERLVQVRGYTNKSVTETDVKEFLNSWCRTKNIAK